MLELLPGFVLVRICHLLTIDLCYVWETIDDEGTQEDRIGDLIVFDGKRVQCLEGLKLRDLNEAVDIVILEEEPFKVYKSLEL